MSTFTFTKAEKTQAKLRLAILGPTGAGKTYTALSITEGRRVAVIDSENRSSCKYADRFNFDVLDIPDRDPRTYLAAIHAAEESGYEVVIIDSLTHGWKGALELVDQETTRSRSSNSFQSWGKVTPIWDALMQSINGSKIHVIATIRSKTEWLIEENDRGKKVPRKVGTKPECRDGVEYDFDVVLELDQDHNAWTTKTRCADLDGKTWKNPSAADFGAVVFGWLESGAPAPIAAQPAAATAAIPSAKPVWTTEQKAEAGALKTRILAASPDRAASLDALSKAGLPASETIDRLNEIAREVGA
jgi:hypothetical protein